MSSSLRICFALGMTIVSSCSDLNEIDTRQSISQSQVELNAQQHNGLATQFNIGQNATDELIAGWNIDIQSDGTGLPEGLGTVAEGEMLYDNLCATCHGTFGEGEQQWPKLTGGEKSLTDQRPLKTVGSYWPYSTTLWDYINRAMPFPAPQSLEANEVYAITAYVLYMNEVVDSDFVLTKDNLAAIKMPNETGFYPDNRPDTNNQRCMRNCKDPKDVKIIAGPAYQRSQMDNLGQETRLSSANDSGKQIYQSGCHLCHDNGLMQAPRIAIANDWQSRLQLGINSIYNNAIVGIGDMPARGGRNELSNNSIKQAVDYMLNTLE